MLPSSGGPFLFVGTEPGAGDTAATRRASPPIGGTPDENAGTPFAKDAADRRGPLSPLEGTVLRTEPDEFRMLGKWQARRGRVRPR